MLKIIDTLSDELLDYIKDDPVRPDLSKEFRVSNNRFVLAITEQNIPCSMVCVSMHHFVPSTVQELNCTSDNPTTAVFYTIWSYKSGSGSLLLREAISEIQQKYQSVNVFVTLSPKTEMARQFHTKNGAVMFRENMNTVNYQYFT